MGEEKTEIKDVEIDGYPMKEKTVYFELENGEREVIYQAVYAEPPDTLPEPTLTAAEQAALTAALNTEYLVCIYELTN